MRALKFAGLLTCGLALSVTGAAAAPQVLDDTDLDGVVAGFQVITIPGTQSQALSDFLANRSTQLGSIVNPVQQEVVVAREIGTTVVTETPEGGKSSTTTTSGDLKADALANPGKYQALYPTPTPSPIGISFPFSFLSR